MPMFRKKPVVIEARQVTEDDLEGVADWCGGIAVHGAQPAVARTPPAWPHIVIHTLEGDHRADIGDWVIKGVKGEYYPIKPNIFVMTYESVEGDD